MKNFALIGTAGFVAPRHLKAIHSTGNRLIAAADPHDAVGILDSFFRDTRFFTDMIYRFHGYVAHAHIEYIQHPLLCVPLVIKRKGLAEKDTILIAEIN